MIQTGMCQARQKEQTDVIKGDSVFFLNKTSLGVWLSIKTKLKYIYRERESRVTFQSKTRGMTTISRVE